MEKGEIMKKTIFTLMALVILMSLAATSEARKPSTGSTTTAPAPTGGIVYNCPWC